MTYVVFTLILGRKTQVGTPTRSYAVAEVAATQLRSRGQHAQIEVQTRSMANA